MDAYTTHQAAKLLGVSLPTVVNWVKSGKLDAYRTPGGHRRIPAESIAVFCRSFGIPEPLALQHHKPQTPRSKPVIAIAGFEKDFSDLLQDFLTVKTGFHVQVSETPLALGFVLAKHDVGILVIDWAHFGIDLRDLHSNVPENIEILFLCSREGEAADIRGMFPENVVLLQPVPLEEIHAAIGRRLETLLAP